jgi:hypothetical protein
MNSVLANYEHASSDRAKMADLRRFVQDQFATTLAGKGYAEGVPGPLIPEHDESVLFTGAATNTMKPYLRGDQAIPGDRLFMVQTCLRTQNVKSLSDADSFPRWASYFNILGAITHVHNTDELSGEVWRFLTKSVGIPEDRLKVRIASKDADLLQYWQKSGYDISNLEIDANDPVYYTHKYGMDGVSGRNYNFAVTDPVTGKYRDFGNIIIIETEDRKIAVEVGMGVETLIAGLLGLPSSINATLMADIIPVTSGASLKLADALGSSIAILDTGQVSPRARKGEHRGRILKQYLQGVIKLRAEAGFTIDEVRRFAEEFEIREYGAPSIVSQKIYDYLSAYEKFSAQQLTEHKFHENMAGIIGNLAEVGHKPRRPQSSAASVARSVEAVFNR